MVQIKKNPATLGFRCRAQKKRNGINGVAVRESRVRERDKGGGQADRLMDVERKSKKGKKMKIGSKRFRLKGQVYEQVKHPVLEQEMCSRIHLSHATNIKTKYRRKQKAAEQGRCALSHKQENK